MKTIYFILVSLLAWLCVQTPAQAGESQRVTSGKASAQLVTSYDQALPNSDIHIALSLRLEKHWHTYWRNAGGPGVPAELHWTLPQSFEKGFEKGFEVGEIVWPLPKIVHTGPIVNYAFEDRLLLPMSLHIPKGARIGDIITIDVEASYLVCYEVCLPESAKLSLDLKIGEPIKDARWMANINRALKAAPKPNSDFTSAVKREGEQFILDIKSEHLQAGKYKNPYFFPYVQDVIDADAPQVVQQGTQGLRLKLTPGWAGENEFQSMQGVVSYEQKIDGNWKRRGVIINARTGTSVDIGALKSATSSSQSSGATFGLLAAVLSAFIGGMILNLMPCVFPVLSLKALSLSQTAHTDKGKVRRHGWLYTAGVMASFMALAAVLLSLKAGGTAIGWGFQLQSPVLLACLAILFFIIALNLFGLFELGGKFIGNLQNAGGGLTQTPGGVGAFFTGVLAVIVATPCTAPFMAGALGYAFTQSELTALLIFIALGFGFALPFLALSYAPHLLKRFPKPGPWMDVFKQFLAFPMLGTVIWLIWVLSSVSGEVAVLRLMSAMLGVAFAIWMFKRAHMAAKMLALVVLVFSGYLIVTMKPLPPTLQSQTAQDLQWSSELVAQYRAQGHPVFVDFTARWCVSCKVNEKLVLNTQTAQDLFAKTNTKVLIADWTRKDDVIAAELARHGRSGVPLYLLYSPDLEKTSPYIFPQILTFKSLKKALNETAIKSAQ